MKCTLVGKNIFAHIFLIFNKLGLENCTFQMGECNFVRNFRKRRNY
jgi:hypothetical protein